jgi:hypothetical protein
LSGILAALIPEALGPLILGYTVIFVALVDMSDSVAEMRRRALLCSSGYPGGSSPLCPASRRGESDVEPESALSGWPARRRTMEGPNVDTRERRHTAVPGDSRPADSFNAALNTEEYVGRGLLKRWDNETVGYDLTYRDQVREPLALLGLQVPVIAAVNGPVFTHAELALLNDIVICSDTTVFADGHWELLGIVPGDGVHTVFRELLGHNRGRYFLSSGQRIGAEKALRLGLVGEVLPADQVLARAWEIARTMFMTKSRVQRRLARATLIQPWRELFVKEIAFGMAHECLGAAIGPPAPVTGPLAEAFGLEESQSAS